MADFTVHNDTLSATALAADLQRLASQTERLERAVLGTQAVLGTVLGEGMLEAPPADRNGARRHDRALLLLHTLSGLIDAAAAEADFPAIDIADLAKEARSGKLKRDT